MSEFKYSSSGGKGIIMAFINEELTSKERPLLFDAFYFIILFLPVQLRFS